MPCPEVVIWALVTSGEAADSFKLAQRAKAFVSARQQLMSIALVADVPDHNVLRQVVNGVKGRRQLHHTQVRGKVAASLRHLCDDLLPELIRELPELLPRKLFQIPWFVYGLEYSYVRSPSRS